MQNTVDDVCMDTSPWQAKQIHHTSSYCNTAAALNMQPGCIMNLLDATTAGQYNRTNTRLIFKVFVPYGHICTELNSLQNVH